MASLAQFAFTTVKSGLSARAGLESVRAAGLKVRDATWYKMVGEARAMYASRVGELSAPQNRRPRGVGEVTAIPTRTKRGYLQMVDVWIRPKGSAEPIVKTQWIPTNTLMSRQAAVDEAVRRYRAAQVRRAVTGATITTLPDAVIVGGIYVGTTQFIPEDEFAPE